MPVRRAAGTRLQEREPDPRLFSFGDGTWTYFDGEPVCASKDEARKLWGRVRRNVWLATPRMRIPAAAEIYDGLTRLGWERMWSSWNHVTFELQPVLDALEADRFAVRQFIADDSRAAQQIRPCLDLFQRDLHEIERIARAFAQHRGDVVNASVPSALNRSETYAGTLGIEINADDFNGIA